MKYWRGYLIGAIIAAITWGINHLAAEYSALVDMVYPYLTRTVQTFLAEWSGGVNFCLWQVGLVVALLVLLTTVVLMIILRWNPIQWLGWVATGVAILYFVNTCVYGLNYHAGPIASDIRLNVTPYTLAELENAAVYYRDLANALSTQVPRDESGNLEYSDFHTLSAQAADGFKALTYDHSYSVFAGCTKPVKELGWSQSYTKQGITGMTVGITGESAVNPETPAVGLPFAICHEMAHRMCIAIDRDANFAAFLACTANPSIEYQYSGYLMAYRYCYNALYDIGSVEATDAAARVNMDATELLVKDMKDYSRFLGAYPEPQSGNLFARFVKTKTSATPDQAGIDPNHTVSDLLVCWHIQEVVLPSLIDETESEFDPYDETQVDLTDIVGAMDKHVMSGGDD